MAATRLVEVERGTCVGSAHSHNGYYAGDFSRRRVASGVSAGALSLQASGQAEDGPVVGQVDP